MAARARPDGWWYPWIFVVGMGLVIVVNIGLVLFAVNTFTGISTTDHYRRGLRYQTAVDAEHLQEERGWKLDLDVAEYGGGDAPREAELSATFVDRNGRPLEDLTVNASLIRPTHQGYDVPTVPLVHRGGGHYVAVVPVPLPGRWNARVTATRGDDTHLESRPIFLKQ